MVIRETPKNLSKYLRCAQELSDYLQFEGFQPIFMDMKFVYFKKDKILEDFIEKVGDKI